MQRALAYALSPAPGLPLRFLLTAPWVAALAGVVLLLAGDSVFVSRWSPPTLAATHLLTLGCLTMAMAGSMLQLIPVVTGVALPASRAAAALIWIGLSLGALLLAMALGLNANLLFVPAALLLALAIATLITIIGRPLARPASPAALPMVRGMRLAIAGLVIALATGLVLAATLDGVLVTPVLLIADLHAAWGLLGWVAMLVVGVAFQVIPMFQSSQLYPFAVARWTPWALAGLLAVWSFAWVAGSASAAVPALLIGAALAAFSALTARLLATRKRKELDATTLYWRLSLASLAASALLYQLPDSRQTPLIVGIVFIGGFAMGAVNGMLYKIVPFLLWYHLQHNAHATRGAVPTIRVILPDALARRQFWWHAAALAALSGAVYAPAWLARPGAALLVASSMLLGVDLWRATLRCRRIERSFQPS